MEILGKFERLKNVECEKLFGVQCSSKKTNIELF